MSSFLRNLPFLLSTLLVVCLVMAALLLGLRQLNLYPPKQLTIAAGAPGSAYHDAAAAYQRILARDGIVLKILETAGSVENAARLEDEEGADIALVQGGVPLADDLEGLASVQLEPVWFFSRADAAAEADPNQWRGLRVATGAPGSGSRLIAGQLADITGAGALDRERAIAIGGAEASEALLAGEIDVALFVAPATATYLAMLIESEQIRHVSLANGEAIALKLRTARQVRMPSGILSYEGRLPATDLELIAVVTRLVARDELHPALVNRLVHAVLEVHADREVIIPANRQYPSAADMDIESNTYAAQLLDDGFSPLEKLLPYWIVAQFNRILLVLLPAIFVLLPLLRLLPSLFQWIFRGRVYRHYARIHEIDQAVAQSGDSLSREQRAELRAELDRIEQRLRRANLPNSYRKQAYTLTHHVDYVRRRIDETQSGREASGVGAPDSRAQTG
jgi:TRAP-type uncharacterized transport system substrate-binding protein